VWLQVGPIQLVVLARRTFAINHPVLYTHLGMDVESAKMVVLKTASNFQFFERWRKSMIRVDSPGVTQSNLRAFDWKHVPRPIYPLDEMNNWN
jgi:microcystin degradation protein MlrC